MRPDIDPSIPIFTTPWTAEHTRTGPFSLSLGLHLLIVLSVLLENYMRPPLELHIVPPEQLLADDRYELTWPVFPDDLPPVQPVEKPQPAPQPKAGDAKPPRFRLPQQVVADDSDAASRRQMIWDQAPQVELTRDVRSPNFVEPQLAAVQRPRFEPVPEQPQVPGRQALTPEPAPRVETSARQDLSPDVLPQPARLRYWREDVQEAIPKNEALAAEQAPRIEAGPSTPELAALEPGPQVRYWTPETPQAAPQRRALISEAAPAVSGGPGQGLDIGDLQQPSRLRYWTPEQGVGEPGKRALDSGPAPQIQAGAGAGGVDVAQFQRLSRLRYQSAEEGSASQAAPSRAALAGSNEAAPNLGVAAPGAQGGAADLIQAQALASLGTVPPPGALTPGRAVVGVDPDPSAPLPPRGTRSGNFSAGPDGGAAGAGSGNGNGDGVSTGPVAGVRIPNLSVTPASPGASSGLADTRPPGPGSPEPPNADREALLRQFRNASYQPAPTLGALAPEAPPNPDFPFPGREVYTLAVNMPNINSYSGSWIIEFAEVKQAQPTPGELTPPSPRLKVDPVYSREAIEERIEGDVVLHAMIRTDGLVDHIQVIKRLDARLDESAKVALSKWRFHPATKRGVPVDIETIVRIPFRLTSIRDLKR